MPHPATLSPLPWQPGGATPQPIPLCLCLPWDSQCCRLPADPGGLGLQKCQGAVPRAGAGHGGGPPHSLHWPRGAGERLAGPQHARPRRSGARGAENLMVPRCTMPVWGQGTRAGVLHVLQTQPPPWLRLFHSFVPIVPQFPSSHQHYPTSPGQWGARGHLKHLSLGSQPSSPQGPPPWQAHSYPIFPRGTQAVIYLYRKRFIFQ